MDDMDDNEPLRRWYKYHRPEYLGNPVAQTDTSSRGKRGIKVCFVVDVSFLCYNICMYGDYLVNTADRID